MATEVEEQYAIILSTAVHRFLLQIFVLLLYTIHVIGKTKLKINLWVEKNRTDTVVCG